MINRSVPGYATVVGMTGTLAAQHARPGSQIYDLGCFWGASLLSVAREPACDRCALIGVDNSEAMLEQASRHLAQFQEASRMQLQHSDVLDTPLHNASVVIMNYTLQFIPIEEREGLLKRIREAMMPGDVLILSEKLTLPDPRLNEYLIDLHHDFKRQQGYSDLEIAQKRQALEDVLVPETRERMSHASGPWVQPLRCLVPVPELWLAHRHRMTPPPHPNTHCPPSSSAIGRR